MRRPFAAALLLVSAPLAAQTAPAEPAVSQSAAPTSAVVTAGPPTRVAVTIYRNPNRRSGQTIDLRQTQGFAVVTETRRVRLPKGRTTIRFEGVAGGIVPASALIEGFPGGITEKNRDRRLLSPASLVDGSLGRHVTIRRTNPATGERVEEDAVVLAGPRPGVVLATSRGVETLRCSGLPETLTYDGVPPGLSPDPVLSVAVVSQAARTATVTLSYLAQSFDWSASYVATLTNAGNRMDLFAWLTLANGNDEGFADARVQAVAGRLNRTGIARIMEEASALSLTCLPLGTTTSDLRVRDAAPAEIIVTGARQMAYAPPPPPMFVAPLSPPPPEDLGDLKLYTVQRRVTVAAKGQKQVALLVQKGVAVRRVYRLAVQPRQTVESASTAILLSANNEVSDGLGVPLPSGTTSLYTERAGERLLLGLGTLGDTAVGERLRFSAGTSEQVSVSQRNPTSNTAELTVSNANPFAVEVEVPIGALGMKDLIGLDQPLPRDAGVQVWKPIVPANDRSVLSYGF